MVNCIVTFLVWILDKDHNYSSSRKISKIFSGNFLARPVQSMKTMANCQLKNVKPYSLLLR